MKCYFHDKFKFTFRAPTEPPEATAEAGGLLKGRTAECNHLLQSAPNDV